MRRWRRARRDAAGIAGGRHPCLLRPINWIVSPAVRRGDASNHVELSMVGTRVEISINGQRVHESRDGRLTEGQIAIGVSPFGDRKVVSEGRIDNVVVRRP